MDLLWVPHLRPAPAPEPPPHADPDVLRASEWLGRRPAEPAAIVLGVPFGGGSISRARCDLAPAAIRRALARFTVWSSDEEISLEELPVLDAGDVEPADGVEPTQERVAETVAALARRAPVPFAVLGGDDSVTVGCARGVGADGLLTFDAHHDCRDPARGASNGSAVRQLVEGGLKRVAQVGIHGFANAEPLAAWADEHGIAWAQASHVRSDGIDQVVDWAMRELGEAERVWVNVDLDVLDRAFAPGAPAALPGGLWPADLERAAFLLGVDRRVAGLGVVELDPTADVGQATVRAACAVLLSFLAGVTRR